MLLISHLNQEDLCATIQKCSTSISIPPALQNLFYKIPVERQGLVTGTHLGRFGATEMGGGGSPHVTDIVPTNFSELGAMKSK